MTHRFFAALSVLVCATANAKTIEGQVFIVTAGGPAIKLALVQVRAISKIEIENHIAKIEQQIASQRAEANSAMSRAIKESDALARQMRKESDVRIREMAESKSHTTTESFDSWRARVEARTQSQAQSMRELRARQEALNSAAPFFVDLPQSVATAKTDAEGRFQLTVPDEGEYVLVASAERTVFKDVERYFWMVRLNSEELRATLSNDNLTTSGSPDSLLTTKE